MRMLSTIAASAVFVAIIASAHDVLADQNRAIAFATNIWPNVNFLDKSSRLAIDHSHDPAVRTFARSEAADQTVAANTLVAWLDSVTAQPTSSPSRKPHQSNVLSMPFRAAAEVSSGMADEIDGVQTGRSVAVDEPVAKTTPSVRLKDIDLTSADANIKRLSNLSGKSFDALYKAAQVDALMQLSTIYATYVQEGEDPGLRNFAIRQLPRVSSALSRLRTMR